MDISTKKLRKLEMKWSLFVFIFLICFLLINSLLIPNFFGLTINGQINDNKPVTVLFDEAHLPLYGVNGAEYLYWAGYGLIDVAQMLINNNFVIDTLGEGETIEDTDLDSCDIFVIVSSRESYLQQEIDRLYAWVKNGGSLFLISEYGGFYTTTTNVIAERFGFEYGDNHIYDYEGFNANIANLIHQGANLLPHEITTNISRIETYHTCGFKSIPEYSQAIITTDGDGTAYWSDPPNYPANNVPILCIIDNGGELKGKVVLINDAELFHSFSDDDSDEILNIFDSDNLLLALNIFTWLSTEFVDVISVESIYFSFVVIFGVFVYFLKYRRKHHY